MPETIQPTLSPAPSPTLLPPSMAKIPSFLVQKFAWGMSGFSVNMMNNGIAQVAMVIYGVALGVRPELITWGLAIPRILEALLGPFVGSLSDNFRSRWGRRRPFTVIGAVLSGLFFALVWLEPARLTSNGPHWYSSGLFWYFLITSMLFFVGYSIYSVPTGSLSFELSTDYNERTRILAWSNFFGSLSGIAIVPWMWWLAFKLGKHAAGVKPDVAGMRTVGILVGLVITLFAILPGLFCREGAEVMRQPKFNMWRAIWDALRNRAFMILSGVVLMLLVGLFAVTQIGTYLGIYYVCRGNAEFSSMLGGWGGSAYNVIGIASLPLIAWLSARLGKRGTLLDAQLLIFFGSLSSWFLNNPRHPWWSLIPALVMCPGLTCLWLMTSSMMMEVCDLDELQSGLRREGMFGAVFGLIFKIGLALSTILSGYMVAWTGYVANKPLTDLTIFRLRSWFAVIPAACLIVTMILTRMFPITEQSARQVRAELDARKRAAAGAEAALR